MGMFDEWVTFGPDPEVQRALGLDEASRAQDRAKAERALRLLRHIMQGGQPYRTLDFDPLQRAGGASGIVSGGMFSPPSRRPPTPLPAITVRG